LIGAGHAVTGLASSDAAAADAAVHLANKHDWADPQGADRTERLAVEAILAGAYTS
jgi:hypothetical protein